MSTISPIIYRKHSRVCLAQSPAFRDVSRSTAFALLIKVDQSSYLIVSSMSTRRATRILLKHFPTFKTKFIPDAVARTVAPESFRILFSQRRRWINSTVHNLCELILLPELFGFCCFSTWFFVFIDLLCKLLLTYVVGFILTYRVKAHRSQLLGYERL